MSSARDFLRERGLDESDIAAAQSNGTLPVVMLDQLMFPDESRYTDAGAAAAAGVDLAWARTLWRAMGFPASPEGSASFYQDDVEALRSSVGPDGVQAPEVIHQTRVLSSAMARFAEQITDSLLELSSELRRQDRTEEDIADVLLGQWDVGVMERTLSYMFRRQLSAAAWRRFANPAQRGVGTVLTVGFVDLVRFTALTAEVADDELERIVDRFEEIAHSAIADGGGRVVKMLGDAVMFVFDRPENAVSVAVNLVGACAEDKSVPPARAGLATGRVLAREGDYFGPAVNLASRIVDVARPDRVVVSEELRDVLKGSDAFVLRPLPAKRLKGIGAPPLYVVAVADHPAGAPA